MNLPKSHKIKCGGNKRKTKIFLPKFSEKKKF